MVKSVTYLHTRQFDKAKYFIESGVNTWPTKAFEFKFNGALLFYLQGDYQGSAQLLKEILA